MLDDAYMWPLVLANGMMADPHVARAGWREFKGDPILSGIQRDKALGKQEAEHELRTWLMARGGDLRTELFQPRRIGSIVPSAPLASLVVVLPDAAIPPEQLEAS
ncbi:MAG TPA: hypothetical protein VHJ58_04235 [Vicinamibacterales bacterium]|jgi:hypothetical protein|nr:hypothetical protein [Vicinamibacterales bacterium]